MPALNFQKRFADAVERGLKQQTIRAYRKRRFEEGDTLYLYTGMRTKVCRKLGEVVCSNVSNIEIDWTGIGIDGLGIPRRDCELMAEADGFTNFEEMVEWFDDAHGTPFRGQLIQWTTAPRRRT